MTATKWWKCDLQVATPAWNFNFPAGSNYAIGDFAERKRFLDDYMAAVNAAGIEIIALADHNTGSWIDDVKAAGTRHNVIVFPGVEITTHTGADGIHLIILGDVDKTSQDFDRLLHGQLGFNHLSPVFIDNNGTKTPGTSSKTLIQILDDLPEGFLAIAPHALNDNGIASSKTIRGDMRWKALHHERMVAIDPGDCSQTDGEGFNARLRRRELDDFPRLKEIAYIATSDAYSMDKIGSRFTWLRMGEVNIEGLRQTFLDHESRVLCDWSPLLDRFPERDPNKVRHAWITSVTLGGKLGNSDEPLTVPLHPNLNVIIGGRGSGKSTVVAGLRQLYLGTDTLPKRLRDDATNFVDSVFAAAKLESTHRIQESQELQTTRWEKKSGSTTYIAGEQTTTNFPVTVINQKELFERAAGDKNDIYLSSRSLLTLVDSSLGYNVSDVKTVGSYGRQAEDARVIWTAAVRRSVLLTSDLAQLANLRKQAITLQGQVDAFSSEEVKMRLARIDARRNESASINNAKKQIEVGIEQLRKVAGELVEPSSDEINPKPPFEDEYATHYSNIKKIASDLSAAVVKNVEDASAALLNFETTLSTSPWQLEANAALTDLEEYKNELQAKGLSTSEFSRLQDELAKTKDTIRRLEEMEPQLALAVAETATTWNSLLNLAQGRREGRHQLFDSVHEQSGRLRFKKQILADTAPWIDSFRSIANFRADAFLEDVPTLSTWLWTNDDDKQGVRWDAWRTALSTGDMSALQEMVKLRPTFVERLTGMDENIRLRLASIFPDDVVMMEFLRENGNPVAELDWQSITEGSPGQRTAAMLAFVLHHGREPLILDQPEDDLDSEWISKLVVKELRQSRWNRQLIVISHNANIPVLGDAEQVIALENRRGSLCVRSTIISGNLEPQLHIGPVENLLVRNDIQAVMEGGVSAFIRREQKYNNETRLTKKPN